MRLTRLVPRIDWSRVALRYLPFADAATPDLPLPRLIRLSLFQLSVGMATVLMVGTLNRVMIVELGVGAWLVSAMVALPLVVAPLRALIGLKSDLHRSFIGWRRVPFVWFGTLLQFGGLAIMPFALILLSGQTQVQLVAGHVASALSFLLVGAGLQVTQTAGLALATDLAPGPTRPRVVALMYVMLLAGMAGCGMVFSLLLQDFSPTRLVQVVQGTALVTMLLNAVSMWKQEPRTHRRAPQQARREPLRFAEHWAKLASRSRMTRFLVTVGLGTMAFNMQDIILEPYGGEVLGLPVGATTLLTGLTSLGSLAAFAWAARLLGRGADPMRVASFGLLAGLAAFSAVIFADPMGSPTLFRVGALLIGFGNGLFAVGTLSAAMALDCDGLHGLVLGAWGAVQATCAGTAIALGGALRDLVAHLGADGALGEAMRQAGAAYGVVYHLELVLLFVTLVTLGPLVRPAARREHGGSGKLGLADLPG